VLTAEALSRCNTYVVTPIDFFHLIWATLPGSLFFGESIDNLVWIFSAVVISSVS
jgi:drug/metabolite transporter (DMT)-like permease